ncbi:hypothetical protein [Algoriphagus halophilus]|uniref:Uncharacterized protein n=1 Tax=Algoriphagus halophilus TaxID=226505 RepID=A0A1N6EFI3_9BACT|nr:hypothetical protein [Algoriphagus halophilus]SIN81764.1 hypothetical protein SAMN05444394_2090 [Algoriphagus halophilus]
MKNYLVPLVICLFFTVSFGYGQQMTVDDEITLIQEAFGNDKKMIVESYMDLPESIAPVFWTVYQAYELERKAIARDRIKIIDEYLNKYSSLGEYEADDLAKRTIKNDMQLSKLHSKYYKKFKKATSAIDAAKFLQIDTYIHNTIRNALQQELPFIGEN